MEVVSRRIVLVHPDGLHQICGFIDVAPPVTIENTFVSRGRRIPFVSIFKANHRAVYYKEPMVPQAPRAQVYSEFDPEKPITFDPSQT